MPKIARFPLILRREHVRDKPDTVNRTKPPHRPEDAQTRRERLDRRVRGHAVVVACGATVPIVLGLRWSGVMFLLVLVLVPVLWHLNGHVLGRMTSSPPYRVPLYRVAVSVLLGAAVAFSTALWVFQPDVAAVRAEPDPVGWERQRDPLLDERRELERVLGQPVPVPNEDPEVKRLHEELARDKKELHEAEKQVLCEQDGTCGTGDEGEAEAYRDKAAFRDRLSATVKEDRSLLNAQIKRVNDRAAELKTEQRAAGRRMRQIDLSLDELGPTRPVVPTRVAALFTVGERKTTSVGLVLVAVLVAVLFVDWFVLRLVVRHGYRRPRKSGEGLSIKKKVDSQWQLSGSLQYPETKDGG